MSAPRTKRRAGAGDAGPSQRPITAFFSKNIGESTTAAAASSVPALPSSVQANLLSVGMRVRKSVPEGYKTGSAYSAFSLWSETDRNKPLGQQQQQPEQQQLAAPAHIVSHTTINTPVSNMMATASSRELTPFCGIHKVGGLAVQPQTTTAAAVYRQLTTAEPAEDDMPGLTSSQTTVGSSILSSSPAAAANRKRLYLTEEEEEQVVGNALSSSQQSLSVSTNSSSWPSHDDWLQDDGVSPRSLAPMAWTGVQHNNINDSSRIMAVPRSRKIPGATGAGVPLSLKDLGQENVAVVGGDGDFEDAPFLDYPSLLAEAGGEMELE